MTTVVARYQIPIAGLGGATVLVSGLLALGGWLFRVPVLSTLVPGLATTKPNTAAALAISGACLVLASLRRGAPFIRAGGALVALAGLATMAEHLSGRDLGIDGMLVGDTGEVPVRMAVNTALSLVLAGIALVIPRSREGGRLAAEGCALLCLAIAVTTLIGYTYSARSLTGFGLDVPMSFHTALSALVLSGGLLALHPTGPLVARVQSGGPGAPLLRKVLPLSALLLVVIGLARLAAQSRGWFDTPFGVAIMVMSAIVVFAVSLFWSADAIDRGEHARLRAERDLRAGEERLRRATEEKFAEVLEAAPDAMLIVDAAGRIDRANSQVEKLFGYTRQELTGERIEKLIPERFRDRHPGHRQKYFSDPRLRPMGAALDLWGRRRNGTEFPVEISLSPLNVEGGVMAMAAIRDVTVRRAAEAKFRDVLEAAPDAMVLVDRGGRIGLVNTQAERLFGYRREELLGLPIETLVPERFHKAHPGHRTDYFSEPRPRPMGTGLELSGRRRDGTEFPVEISLSPVETEDGTMVTAAVRDITDRKRLLEEIQKRSEELEVQSRRAHEANRLKSEFLANMSHELRTPLNAIIGFSELMYDGRVGPMLDEHREYLGDILSSSKHLLQLINDVLDLAKVEAGKMEFHPEPVDLARLTAEVRDILRTLAAKKGITVETDIHESARQMVTDPAKLKQVLYNYLSNATKFTPEGGQVVVRARGEGADQVRIEVQDTGIGIQPHDLERLFVEFQQLDASSAKKYQGTGLGLALTRRIAEAGGGHVEVRSTPGAGSTFSVVLPRNQATALAGRAT